MSKAAAEAAKKLKEEAKLRAQQGPIASLINDVTGSSLGKSDAMVLVVCALAVAVIVFVVRKKG